MTAHLRIVNLQQIVRRANNTTDPRSVFYQAVLGSKTVEEYLSKVGDVVVVPPTYKQPMGAKRELNYMRHNRGWLVEATTEEGGENKTTDGEAFRPNPEIDARTRTIRNVINRQGQSLFRRELLRIYEGRCAVTGCSVQPLLEAAHVTPYLGEHTNELSNGILLRVDVHNLWDLGLLALDPVKRIVHINSTIAEEDSMYAQLSGKRVRDPNLAICRPSEESLRSQWDFFLSMRE